MVASPNFSNLPAGWTLTRETIRDGQISIKILHRVNQVHYRSLFVVHGHGEHSERYFHWPAHLQNSVDAIALLDLPGHGESKGARGWVQNFSDYFSACAEAFLFFEKWSNTKWKKSEMFWHGHSLGGLITLSGLTQNSQLSIRAVSVSAPLLEVAFPIPVIKATLGKLIAPLLGQLQLSSELNPQYLSRDQSVVATYQSDPLVHSIVTPNLFVEMTKEMEFMSNQEAGINYPLLMMIPLGDRIVSWKASFNYFNKIKSKGSFAKKISTFPLYSHEPFNDLQKEIPFNCLNQWILELT